ncbi:hypothetical protein T440DRAFT_556990 [Plenodomus tracheiphilus IPT5]|uniref:Uncharacterized protein n=1 Tax=Plenodomus tracheiphilus IPT5 TaxID=1408161 RepID=A0A6A7B010_9PLEO|nr:hypothetical protein T440DRAFT_556990 [Plenodomus tracheiphilus IPT5]
MNTDGPACSIRKGDAMKYVAQVKHEQKQRFANNPEQYTNFLSIFSEIYGANAPDRSYEDRIALAQVGMKDKVFKHHPDLFEGFLEFVPKGETTASQGGGSGGGDGDTKG